MKKFEVTQISKDEFQKMIDSSVLRVCKNAENEIESSKENPEFFTGKELKARWNIGENTLRRFQKDGLKRTVIGGSIRFRFRDVMAFEKEKSNLISKAKKQS